MSTILMPSRFSDIRFQRGIIFSFEEFLHTFSGQRPDADFSYITGNTAPVGRYSEMSRTVINDLRGSEEEIFRAFNDSTRHCIHQVIKKDLCTYQFIEQPSDDELVKLHAQCREFADRMKIPMVTLNYLRTLNKGNRLNVSYVYDKNNVMLAAHGYRLSEHRPELAYSIRPFEAGATKERLNLLAKANRYGHYRDMLQFKSMGYEMYDFGGVSDGKSCDRKWNNIDEFKLYFGGQVVTYYNSILYNTVKSKVYLKLRGNPF